MGGVQQICQSGWSRHDFSKFLLCLESCSTFINKITLKSQSEVLLSCFSFIWFQGVYGENGSLMYHHGYGYAPYGPYSPAASPVPTVGHDGQLYGAQHYQYPAPYFQSLTPTSGPFPSPTAPSKGEIATSGAADQAPLSVDSTNSKSIGIANNGSAPARATYQNSSFNGSHGRGQMPGGVPASGYQDPRFGFDGLQSPFPWLESPYFSDGQPRPVTSSSMTSSIANVNSVPSSRNQNFRPHMMVKYTHIPHINNNSLSEVFC